MATFTKTISNVVNAFGGADTNRWGVYNWNAFKWGDGTTDLTVMLARSIDAGSLTLDSAMSLQTIFIPTIANTVSLNEDISSAMLIDENGYYYVYPSDVTNIHNRSTPTYLSLTVNTSTYSSQTVSSNSWSST